ncbi:MAG TPA: sugar ABC transporter permease [Alphaproteobacteria bacterium]|nr:sugar ABC transporter permease [Alphaproteobacteria bacterium]
MTAAAIATNHIIRNDRRFGWLMTAPGLVALMLVVTGPLVVTIVTSAFEYTLVHPGYHTFVGIDNYRSAFTENYFGEAIWVTVKFVVAVVLLEFVIGFTVALMLNAVTRFKNVYYPILLMPLLINPVVVAQIWRMFLHPELGIVNYLIGLVGVSKVNWLGDADIAFWTVVLVDIWHQVSFMIILLLAGLSALPKEPYEAARMDGASTLQSFIHITLPLMRPVIVVTLLIRLIFAIKTFDLIFIMTRGGPGTATDLISYFIYRSAFFGLDIGQASAISVLLLVVVLALTAYLYRYMRSLA